MSRFGLLNRFKFQTIKCFASNLLRLGIYGRRLHCSLMSKLSNIEGSTSVHISESERIPNTTSNMLVVVETYDRDHHIKRKYLRSSRKFLLNQLFGKLNLISDECLLFW